MSPGRTVPSASRAARPRPAPPSRRAPPRSDPRVVCPGFGFDRSRSSAPAFHLEDRSEDRDWFSTRHHGADVDLRPNLRFRRFGGSSIFGAGRTKNPPSPTFSARISKNPRLLLPTPLFDQWSRPPLCYPEIWIFSPIFQLEDRSEDRDRPPYLLGETMAGPTRLAWKGLIETKRRRLTGQQPETKSGFRPAKKLDVCESLFRKRPFSVWSLRFGRKLIFTLH